MTPTLRLLGFEPSEAVCADMLKALVAAHESGRPMHALALFVTPEVARWSSRVELCAELRRDHRLSKLARRLERAHVEAGSILLVAVGDEARVLCWQLGAPEQLAAEAS